MKMLVTGGNRGLGLDFVNRFSADSLCRSNGYDITDINSIKEVAEKSLNYDIFINNAFDGPPHEPWANFGQVNLLLEVYKSWAENNKSGWIFNIGSVGACNIKEPTPLFETYRISKSALAFASKQCSAAFKSNLVNFKTSIITLDRLDTPLSRSRESWTGNGINCNDILNFVDYATNVAPNTVVEEIIFYVNFNYDK